MYKIKDTLFNRFLCGKPFTSLLSATLKADKINKDYDSYKEGDNYRFIVIKVN